MNKENQAQIGAHGIMYAIINKKGQMVALLLRNGVVVATGSSDLEIAEKTLGLLRSSKTFKDELLKMLTDEQLAMETWSTYANMQGQYSNAGGFVVDPAFDFSVLPSGNTWNPTGGSSTSTTPATTPAPGASNSFWSSQNISNLLNTGINALLTLDTNKTNRLLGNSASNVAMYQSQQGGTGGIMPNTYMPAKSNTGLYIGITVIGLILVGTLVYVVNRKN